MQSNQHLCAGMGRSNQLTLYQYLSDAETLRHSNDQDTRLQDQIEMHYFAIVHTTIAMNKLAGMGKKRYTHVFFYL